MKTDLYKNREFYLKYNYKVTKNKHDIVTELNLKRPYGVTKQEELDHLKYNIINIDLRCGIKITYDGEIIRNKKNRNEFDSVDEWIIEQVNLAKVCEGETQCVGRGPYIWALGSLDELMYAIDNYILKEPDLKIEYNEINSKNMLNENFKVCLSKYEEGDIIFSAPSGRLYYSGDIDLPNTTLDESLGMKDKRLQGQLITKVSDMKRFYHYEISHGEMITDIKGRPFKVLLAMDFGYGGRKPVNTFMNTKVMPGYFESLQYLHNQGFLPERIRFPERFMYVEGTGNISNGNQNFVSDDDDYIVSNDDDDDDWIRERAEAEALANREREEETVSNFWFGVEEGEEW